MRSARGLDGDSWFTAFVSKMITQASPLVQAKYLSDNRFGCLSEDLSRFTSRPCVTAPAAAKRCPHGAARSGVARRTSHGHRQRLAPERNEFLPRPGREAGRIRTTCDATQDASQDGTRGATQGTTQGRTQDVTCGPGVRQRGVTGK